MLFCKSQMIYIQQYTICLIAYVCKNLKINEIV